MNMMIRFSSLGICAYLCVITPIMACADNKAAKEDISSQQTETIDQRAVQHAQTSTTVMHQQAEQNTDPQINVSALKKRLRTTHAIGLFTKLAIRNDITDLTDLIKRYRKKSTLTDKLNEIRAHFDGLLLKIVALLDEDPDLSRDLYVGREQIWQSLLEEA